MKALCATLLIFLTISASAQEENRVHHIKAGPLMLFNLINPGFEVSYEVIIKKKFSAQCSAVVLNDLLNITPFDKFRGFRIKPQIRYYTYEWRMIHIYAGLEVDYYQSWFNYEQEYVPEQSNSVLATEKNVSSSFDVDKRMILINPGVGIQLRIPRWVFEGFINIGAKKKSIEHGLKKIPDNYDERPDHPNHIRPAVTEQNKWGPNFTFGLRLGLRI